MMFPRYAFLLTLFGITACSGGSGSNFQNDPGGETCTAWPAGVMIGTEQSDELLDVVIDKQGNIYLAGYETGVTGVASIDPAGDARGVVLKYGPGGQLIWKQVIDTSGTDVVEALALHPQSGELYLTGRTDGALPGFVNQGQFDLFVGWLTAEEHLPKLAQFGTERPQHPRRIELGLTDQIVVAGYDDIYIPSNYVEAWENPLLATFTRSAENTVQSWQGKFNNTSPAVIGGLAVARATDGAIYITGGTDSGPDRGIFVAKLDSQGTEVWRHRYPTAGVDMGVALSMLPDGNVLLAGSTFAMLGEMAYGQQDVFVRKIDAVTGETLWTGQYGSEGTDWVADMALDAQGQIYLAGITTGMMEPGKPNQGDYDVFFLKLSAKGEVLLQKQWGTGGDDTATAVAVDTCEQAYVVGYSTGDLMGTSNGARDGFVIPVPTRLE